MSKQLNIVLYEPEIPPNTGNIIRLCANTGAFLHLIHPLGFNPTDKQLKRAGLDYHEWVAVKHHADFNAYLAQEKPKRLFAATTKAQQSYTVPTYQLGDSFLFGPETRGLPGGVLSSLPKDNLIRIPMLKHSRSLNLANSAAIILYEALRQIGFNMLS